MTVPLIVTCDGCGRSVVLTDGTDPDGALECGCCPQDHHHGQAADAAGAPCRPITITVGAATVGPVAGEGLN